MPAAAVIPAPIAYIKVVAVKKLVVELLCMPGRGFLSGCGVYIHLQAEPGLHWPARGVGILL